MTLDLKAILIGFLSAFDLLGKLSSPHAESAYIRDDAEAMKADWQAVGDDIRSAITEYQENPVTTRRTSA